MKAILSSLATLILLSAPAGATMIGDTVYGDLYYPDRSTTPYSTATITVASGDSDKVTFGGIVVDVNALSVTFTSQASLPFAIGSGSDPCNCVVLTSLDPGFAISGYTVDAFPTGLTPSDIETTASSLLVDLQGVNMGPGNSFTVTLVPEPTTASLLAAGLCGLGALAYRRRRG